MISITRLILIYSFRRRYHEKVGIVLLGFKLSFGSIIELGPRLVLTVILFVALVMALSIMIGKALGADNRLSALVGVGSCICRVAALLSSVSSWLIMMAMISMGIMVDFKQIKSRGAKSIAIGTALFMLTGPLSYILVLNMF